VDSVLNEFAALCGDPTFFEVPPAGINCASGFIRFDSEGTPKLETHDRDHRCRHTLPGHWQPTNLGDPPPNSLLERLLNGSFKGDADADARANLLSEVCGVAAFGYATRLIQPRAVVLHGKTRERQKPNP